MRQGFAGRSSGVKVTLKARRSPQHTLQLPETPRRAPTQHLLLSSLLLLIWHCFPELSLIPPCHSRSLSPHRPIASHHHRARDSNGPKTAPHVLLSLRPRAPALNRHTPDWTTYRTRAPLSHRASPGRQHSPLYTGSQDSSYRQPTKRPEPCRSCQPPSRRVLLTPTSETGGQSN